MAQFTFLFIDGDKYKLSAVNMHSGIPLDGWAIKDNKMVNENGMMMDICKDDDQPYDPYLLNCYNLTKPKTEEEMDRKIKHRLEWYTDREGGLEAAEELKSMGFPIVYRNQSIWPKAVMDLDGYNHDWVWWFILNEFKVNAITVMN